MMRASERLSLRTWNCNIDSCDSFYNSLVTAYLLPEVGGHEDDGDEDDQEHGGEDVAHQARGHQPARLLSQGSALLKSFGIKIGVQSRK